jgi:methylglutaconyl-CoA hydratase
VGEIIDALLKQRPARAGRVQALIRVVAGQPIDEQTIEETAQRITRVRASPEGQEGLAAFLEKRRPHWLLA